jgi:hypothetical protein
VIAATYPSQRASCEGGAVFTGDDYR